MARSHKEERVQKGDGRPKSWDCCGDCNQGQRNRYATAARIACGSGTDAPDAGSTHTITTLPSA